ncbi:MAG: LytTR family DNA-binding domain-containing protein [Defluviitaleaceae bacterium]|nr:LytTR family DNA-binding domain-containing protein [Defluviitaleaceae bacterium]
MLSVFLCENNNSDTLFKCIHSHIGKKRLDMEISICTGNPRKIIFHIEQFRVNGLYFLELGGNFDIEAARMIRRYDPRGFIVFLADNADFLPLTFEYKLEALAYIQRTDEDEMCRQICECIDDAYDKHVSRPPNGSFVFKEQSGGRISCCLDDILFFETENSGSKLIVLHTKKRRYRLYGTVADVLQELPGGLFFRCHKSCIVNVSNIPKTAVHDLRQGKYALEMTEGGAVCHVSARKKSGLLKLLDVIDFNHAAVSEPARSRR